MRTCLAILFSVAALAACKDGKPTPEGDEIACAKGDPQACTRRLERMRAACDAREVKACVDVADAYFSAIHAPKDEKLATEYFDKACNLDDGRACHMLARQVLAGVGAPRDLARMQKLEEKSCDLGFSDGCEARGECLEHGSKIHGCDKKDLPAARKFYQRSCDIQKLDKDHCLDVNRVDEAMAQ